MTIWVNISLFFTIIYTEIDSILYMTDPANYSLFTDYIYEFIHLMIYIPSNICLFFTIYILIIFSILYMTNPNYSLLFDYTEFGS